MLDSPPFSITTEGQSDPDDTLLDKALKAAAKSYAPYTRAPSGIAMQTDSNIYCGSYIENAAFNPSLSPLQSALANLFAEAESPLSIRRVILVETGSKSDRLPRQTDTCNLMLQAIAPQADFQVIQITLQ